MDLQNSDCIVFMGSNMAECHPCGFKWPMKAKAKGATLIHVDPRFTRTSAMCDQYVPIRSGTDIVFLGGLVNYILTNKKQFDDYVLSFTNAATLVNAGFKDTEDNDGFFSGYNATLVFGGRSTRLVRDDASGVRHGADDDGLRVDHLTDLSLGNGDNDGEYWRVTTQDGTQYFFGRNKRYPGDPAATNAVQTAVL